MPVTPEIRELERVSITCPLGIRFWDVLTGTAVGEGLRVSAAPVDQPQLLREGLQNRRGGFVFHNLPGLREVENGDGDDAFWASPPAQRTFLIHAEDTTGRFLPLVFRAVAPHQGWFVLPCEPSPSGRPADSVPLFSSPARRLAAPVAVLRADLWDVDDDRPAAWALFEASVSTPTGTAVARGMSDARGSVLVAFAYPELAPPVSGGSPPGAGLGLNSQVWDLDLAVYYEALSPSTQPPELCGIVGQSAGALLDRVTPSAVLPAVQLSFGQELVLRSSGDARGRVFVRPA